MDAYTPNLEPGELIIGARVLLGEDVPSRRSGYVKLADGESGAALAGVAAMITAEHGEIHAARIAVTGATTTPQRLTTVELALLGRPLDDNAIAAAATLAADTVDMIADGPVAGDYRRQLLSVACARALTRTRPGVRSGG